MAAAIPWSHEMRDYSAGTEAKGSGFEIRGLGLHCCPARNPTRHPEANVEAEFGAKALEWTRANRWSPRSLNLNLRNTRI